MARHKVAKSPQTWHDKHEGTITPVRGCGFRPKGPPSNGAGGGSINAQRNAGPVKPVDKRPLARDLDIGIEEGHGRLETGRVTNS